MAPSRLAALRRHLCASGPSTSASGPSSRSTVPSSAPVVVAAAAESRLSGHRLQQLREYCSSGVVVVPPEEMGIPLEAHTGLYDLMRQRLKDGTLGGNMTYYEAVPALAHLFEAPGLVATLDNILGEDWAFVPYMHSMFVKAGDQDQGWCALPLCAFAPRANG